MTILQLSCSLFDSQIAPPPVSSSITLLCVWNAALVRTIATCWLKSVVTIVFCFESSWLLTFHDKLYTWRSLADSGQSEIWLQIWSIHLLECEGEGNLNSINLHIMSAIHLFWSRLNAKLKVLLKIEIVCTVEHSETGNFQVPVADCD